MRKTVLVGLVILASSLFAPIVSAREENTATRSGETTTKSQRLEEYKTRRQQELQNWERRKLLIKEKIASQTADIRLKLSEISDERKQQVVENLLERIGDLNQKWVDHWNNVLTRLGEILAKIQSRGQSLASEGKNTSELNGAISDAQAAIATAQAAVNAQAGKAYTIEITSEENLRADAKRLFGQFKSDTSNVKRQIQAAREAVRMAFNELIVLTGERLNVEKESE